MIRRDPFSITLTSNASMDRFPNNTTSRFSNHLPERLVLQGQWEVALTKLRYPLRFYNLSPSCSLDVTHKTYLSDGSDPKYVRFCIHFDSAQETDKTALVAAVNKFIRVGIQVAKFFYVKGDRVFVNQAVVEQEASEAELPVLFDFGNNDLVEIVTPHRSQPVEKPLGDEPKADDEEGPEKKISKVRRVVTRAVPSPMLARMLGYLPDTDVVRNPKATYLLDPFMGFPYEVFVYCDIVYPQWVGNSFVQVIDSSIVEVEPEDSKRLSIEKSFFPQNWVPLLRQEFNAINIDLRDGFGNLIPFADGFSSALVLSFRPKP